MQQQQQKHNVSNYKIYKKICRSLNKEPNLVIKESISGNDVLLPVDFLTKLDIEPLQILLNQGKIKKISLYGGYEQIKQKLKRLPLPQVKFSYTSEFVFFIKIICQTIAKSLELVSLQIRDLKLREDIIDALSLTISQSQSLKELKCINCSLNYQQFAIISNALIMNSSIITIDLTGNLLSDMCVQQIKKVLEEHQKRREKIEQVYKLRGESIKILDFQIINPLVPDEDIALKGLCEMNLSNNKLRSVFIKELYTTLKYDRWLKSLNLKQNEIDQQGIIIVNDLLNHNQTIISLDVRENPGMSQSLSQEIYQKLLQNVQRLKKRESETNGIMLNNMSDINDDKAMDTNRMSSKKINGTSNKNLRFFNLSKQDDVEENMNNCTDCQKYKEQIRKLEKIIKNLTTENQNLKIQNQKIKEEGSLSNKNLQQLSFQNPELQWSGNHSNQNIVPGQQVSTSNVLNVLWQNEQNQNQQEDMITGIELMMNQLTYMMDSLENQNSQTNNLTAHLSSTMLGQNNNTHIILERDGINPPNIMNILGNNSQNNIELQNNSSL